MEPVAPDFVARTAIEKATFDRGWRGARTADGAWLVFGSTSAPGSVAIAALGPTGRHYAVLPADGRLLDALVAEGFETGEADGRRALHARDAAALERLLGRAWQLARSLPEEPLDAFRRALRAEGQDPDLPPRTEAEQVVRRRIGQDRFRDALFDFWDGRCPLTGIGEPELLRASHIVPWADCRSDEERLDVYNGLLLSALWDAAFDKGLVTFDGDGSVLFSGSLSLAAREALGEPDGAIRLKAGHRDYLERHRRHRFQP